MAEQRVVFLNRLAGTGPTLAARLTSYCAYTAMDQAEHERDALLFGIVLGWGLDEDDDPAVDESAWPDLQQRFGWTDADVQAIEAMHAIFKRMETERG